MFVASGLSIYMHANVLNYHLATFCKYYYNPKNIHSDTYTHACVHKYTHAYVDTLEMLQYIEILLYCNVFYCSTMHYD